MFGRSLGYARAQQLAWTVLLQSGVSANSAFGLAQLRQNGLWSTLLITIKVGQISQAVSVRARVYCQACFKKFPTSRAKVCTALVSAACLFPFGARGRPLPPLSLPRGSAGVITRKWQFSQTTIDRDRHQQPHGIPGRSHELTLSYDRSIIHTRVANMSFEEILHLT